MHPREFIEKNITQLLQIADYFSSKPNIRTYMNIRSLRAAFRSLVQASIKEVANG